MVITVISLLASDRASCGAMGLMASTSGIGGTAVLAGSNKRAPGRGEAIASKKVALEFGSGIGHRREMKGRNEELERDHLDSGCWRKAFDEVVEGLERVDQETRVRGG